MSYLMELLSQINQCKASSFDAIYHLTFSTISRSSFHSVYKSGSFDSIKT